MIIIEVTDGAIFFNRLHIKKYHLYETLTSIDESEGLEHFKGAPNNRNHYIVSIRYIYNKDRRFYFREPDRNRTIAPFIHYSSGLRFLGLHEERKLGLI